MPARPRLLLAAVLASLVLLPGCAADGARDPGRAGTSVPRSPAASGTQPGTPTATSAGPSRSATPTQQLTPAAPPPNPRYGMPKVGDCFATSAKASRGAVAPVRKVRCTRTHTSVVSRVALLPRAITARTAHAKRQQMAARLCVPAFRRAVGADPATRAVTLLTWSFFTPRGTQLQRGARWVRCDVLARDAGKLLPLPVARPLLAGGVPESLRICLDGRGADVSCARPHAYRVETAFEAPPGAYPGPAYRAAARDRCRELGGAPGGYWQPPGPTGWNAGDRFVRCLSRSG